MSETGENTSNPALKFLSRLTAKNWIAIVMAALAVIFILQNRRTVRIELLFMSMNAPLWICLGIVLAIGWLVGRFTFRKR